MLVLCIYTCLIATSLIHEPDVVFFLGIKLELKDMLFFISTQRSFFVSKNVLFNEMTFPFKNPGQTSPPTLSLPHGPITSSADPFSIEPMTLPSTHRHHPAADQPIHHTIHSPSTSHSTTPSLPFETPSPSPPLKPTPQLPPRRQLQRETRPPAHLADYYCNFFSSRTNQFIFKVFSSS